jgi:cytochrome c
MRTILAVVAMTVLNLVLPGIAAAQEHATAQEVVAKVREAAATLSKSGDLKPFTQKNGPWVWKDTYVFVNDCDKKVVAANIVMPDQVGQDFGLIKDTKGKTLYPDRDAYCNAAKKPSGNWIEYWWPKPAQKEGSRKVSFYLSAPGTPYVVGAGVYDDKATIAELSKLSSKK